MVLVKAYRPTKEELAEFEQYIVNEYKSGRYLADPENHEYILGNIFKAGVINRQYHDKNQVPIDEFAFDFWQNTKYVYRGVDSLDSLSVKSNEEQMNTALKKWNRLFLLREKERLKTRENSLALFLGGLGKLIL